MTKTSKARRAGKVTPRSDKGPVTAMTKALKNEEQQTPNSPSQHPHGQAQRIVSGERLADNYLTRLQAKQAGEAELAITVSRLYGAQLKSFCAVLEKALGGHHA